MTSTETVRWYCLILGVRKFQTLNLGSVHKVNILLQRNVQVVALYEGVFFLKSESFCSI